MALYRSGDIEPLSFNGLDARGFSLWRAQEGGMVDAWRCSLYACASCSWYDCANAKPGNDGLSSVSPRHGSSSLGKLAECGSPISRCFPRLPFVFSPAPPDAHDPVPGVLLDAYTRNLYGLSLSFVHFRYDSVMLMVYVKEGIPAKQSKCNAFLRFHDSCERLPNF